MFILFWFHLLDWMSSVMWKSNPTTELRIKAQKHCCRRFWMLTKAPLLCSVSSQCRYRQDGLFYRQQHRLSAAQRNGSGWHPGDGVSASPGQVSENSLCSNIWSVRCLSNLWCVPPSPAEVVWSKPQNSTSSCTPRWPSTAPSYNTTRYSHWFLNLVLIQMIFRLDYCRVDEEMCKCHQI